MKNEKLKSILNGIWHFALLCLYQNGAKENELYILIFQ